MVSYWNFDDGTATDQINNNNGSITGATATTGKVNQALNFGANDKYVQVPHNVNLNSNEFTIMAWIKPSDIAVTYIASKQGDSGQPGWGFGILSDGGIFVWNYESPQLYITSNPGLTVDTWHHVAFTHDGSTIQFYIDSTPVGNGSTTSNNLQSTIDLFIGLRARGGVTLDKAFVGDIDEVAIFNETLTPQEITDHYTTSNAGENYC